VSANKHGQPTRVAGGRVSPSAPVGSPGHAADAERAVLALDTATSRVILAVGRLDGTLVISEAWDAGHRHAEELLGRLAALLERAGLGRPGSRSLDGVVVGTGPGGFTGLRVGLATARGLARAAGAPLVGVPTGRSLEAAARAIRAVSVEAPVAILLPAGRSGRYLVRDGLAVLAPPWAADEDPAPGALLVAVDLPGRAAPEALARGAGALDALAPALLALGCDALRAGRDDGALVAPEYVTLPRGVATAHGEVAWSPVRP
jgi:tRNA threonylcarbamoyladenosine biosynthesis protein TsaB